MDLQGGVYSGHGVASLVVTDDDLNLAYKKVIRIYDLLFWVFTVSWILVIEGNNCILLC